MVVGGQRRCQTSPHSLRLRYACHILQFAFHLILTVPSSQCRSRIKQEALTMADPDSTRERIIASVFSRRNAAGNLEETYVGHVKILENDGTEQDLQKQRYILLSETNTGSGFLHKAKLNSNKTFSVGKTWVLSELRGVEVTNPLTFNVTLARTYQWQTEDPNDQDMFVNALVRLFRRLVGRNAPLQVMGFVPRPEVVAPTPTVGQAQAARRQINQRASSSAIAGKALGGPPRPASPLSRFQNPPVQARHGPRPSSPAGTQARARAGSPSGSQLRTRPGSPGGSKVRDRPTSPQARIRATSPANSQTRTRPSSPANSTRSSPSAQMTVSPSRARPSSPSSRSQTSTVRPRVVRRPSAASSIRSTASGQTPSVVPPPVAPIPIRPILNARTSVVQSQNLTPVPPALDVPWSATSPGIGSSVSAASAYDTPISARKDRPPSPKPSPSAQRSHPKSTRSIPPPALDIAPSQSSRRDPNARISYFDPPNQALLDRLLSSEAQDNDGADGEGESAEATMANLEEMLEGYEWASGDILGRKRARGAADQIEARLLDELMALDKANVHSFLESDDRIATVLKYLDDAIAELDTMDGLVSSYKIHLNAVGDDISYIQSQNRGLQVQTQNQKALLNELEQLLQTVHVDRDTLLTLTQESLEKTKSIQRLEEAACELYKALLAGRDNDMAATMERLDEYRTHNGQFCKRMLDFLSIMFTAQSNMLLGNNNGVLGLGEKIRPSIVNHQQLESYLGRYSGLMLYLKEMDESRYSKVCATYFSAASELHSTQMKGLFGAYAAMLKKGVEDDGEQSFALSPTSATYRAVGGLRRAGTVVRSPLDGGKDKDKQSGGDLRTSEALTLLLDQIAPQVYREEEFIADFLQINDAGFTFADYMGLDHYFRRQASELSGLSSSTAKLVRGAMDLIFGFVPAEIKTWLDNALSKDGLQITGILACVERAIADAEDRGNSFFVKLLDKQHQRLKALFDRHVEEQIKAVEDTKLTSKKRKGVAHFIKYFPVYVSRVESQLVEADSLEIRGNVDAAYERIVQSMFDSLKQMAKMEGEGEDKGQLNYHVILIENMHYFVAEIGQQEIVAVNAFRKRAEVIYDENLTAYIRIVLRRPFAKIIDYFEGVERLLKTTAPTEVSKNSAYNRSTLKKVLKEFNTKDVRKNIDALFKRVEKHFTDAPENATTENSSGTIKPGTVLVGVWRACEDELLRVTDLFLKRINQCYADAGLSLEYSVADVESAFKRHRVS
ncbi:hypothetical protein BD410DRAFT_350073 [Rickenella mellea]|uniref:Exocyst complex component Sec3 PIP2-binding N-terminal domain-containing protein n=1 Tax=Rickenella mellea TaxID=50990 RepID=A0A4Y7QLE1_9AGAM|nr:hypothetical protein BD410DRAFT_350073 [Rickenella mellea]